MLVSLPAQLVSQSIGNAVNSLVQCILNSSESGGDEQAPANPLAVLATYVKLTEVAFRDEKKIWQSTWPCRTP